MSAQPVDSEILDAMILSEVAVKYNCISQAMGILTALIQKFPLYLPAKEALQKIYRDMGKTAQANELESDLNQIRSQLAVEHVRHQGTPADLSKRQFIARMDSLVRNIYDTRDYAQVLEITSSQLRTALHVDRCLIWIHESKDWRETRHVSCGVPISADVWEKMEGVHGLLWQLFSDAPDSVVAETIQNSLLFASHRAVLQEFSVDSLLSAPVIYDSQLIGMILLHRSSSETPWNDEEVACLSTMTGHTAVALRNARLFGEVQEESHKDQVTGLESSQFFEERLAVEMRNASHQKYPLCLGLLYVTEFQEIVRSQGQAQTESLLHKIGFLIKTHVRKGSVVGRTGNEEFGMILPNATKDLAQRILNNIKQTIEGILSADLGKPLTLGIGVIEVTLSPTHWTTTKFLESGSLNNLLPQSIPAQEHTSFRGDLAEIELVDVLQILANGRKSGKLLLDAQGQLGIVFFNAGKIVDAVFKNKSAEAAFFDLLTVMNASFEFQPSTQPFTERIPCGNTHLLLEGLRLLDEERHEHQLSASGRRFLS
ncbi:MAG: DUF4388 domain-containing protein [Terriglobia bacterium]